MPAPLRNTIEPKIEFKPVLGQPTSFVLYARGEWAEEPFRQAARQALATFGDKLKIAGPLRIGYERWRHSPATIEYRAQTGLERMFIPGKPGAGSFMVTCLAAHLVASDTGVINLGGSDEVRQRAQATLDTPQPPIEVNYYEGEGSSILWAKGFVEREEFLQACHKLNGAAGIAARFTTPGQIRHEFWRPRQAPRISNPAISRAGRYIRTQEAGQGAFMVSMIVIGHAPTLNPIHAGDQLRGITSGGLDISAQEETTLA